MTSIQRCFRIFRLSGLFPALVLLLVLAAPSARAGVVIKTKNFAGSASLINNSLSLEHFDDALGDLRSVTVSYTMDLSGTGRSQVRCPADAGQTCQSLTNFELDLNSLVIGVGSILLQPSLNPRFNIFCSASPGTITNCSRSESIHASGSDFADDLPTLQLFDGPADLLFNFRGGTSGFVTDISMSGSATIEYTYDERVTVPEPGTLAVSSLALLALVGTGRHRRGQAIQSGR